MPYGAFVEFMPGKDGLLHISEIDWKRLETVEQAGLKEGDTIQVKLVDIDAKTGKFKLSRKVLLPKPEGYEERPPRPERDPRPERGEPVAFARIAETATTVTIVNRQLFLYIYI